jgi:hypothetical protein
MLTEKQMKSIPPKPLIYTDESGNKLRRPTRCSWSNGELNRMFPQQKRNKTFAELLGR